MRHWVFPLRAIGPVVIRFGRLGDNVLLQRLHARYGVPCHLFAHGSGLGELYASHRDVAEVVAFDDRHRPLLFSPQRLRAVIALRRIRAAPFYICEPEPRALGKIQRMLTLAGVDRKRCVFLANLPVKAEEHWVDRLLRFGEQTPSHFHHPQMQLKSNVIAAPRLHVSDADRIDRDAWLRQRGWYGHPLVLLQPANKRTIRWNSVREVEDDDKSWPMERWAALAHAIVEAQPDTRVLLCGSPVESDYLQTIGKMAAHESIGVAAQDFPLARLKATLQVAQAMISVDTGPAHIAAAIGCPLLVLFGAAPLAQWLPRSATGSAVVALGATTHSGRVDAIALQDVVDAWHKLPQREKKSSPEPPLARLKSARA